MMCPRDGCGGELRCTETRPDRETGPIQIIRYRFCLKCGSRFVTKETVIARLKSKLKNP